jgi:hypothetical protein
MTAEAQRIMEVFKARGIRAGQTLHPADFGEAIVWEGGFVRDEPVRQALATLFAEGYVLELTAALELTDRGARYLYDEAQPKHGARVYRLGRTLLIKQTVLRGIPPEYVIDEDRERHVADDDDAAIAAALRGAVDGTL